MPVPSFVHQDLDALQVELTPHQLEQLDDTVRLTLEANTRFNLTAVTEPDAVWRWMVVDSLTALPGLDELEPGAVVIDVGTGGGFPGLPLAIARPTLRFTLVDATGKKATHVRRVAEALGLDHVKVLQERAEALGQDQRHRELYAAAVCRAVGAMNVLLELTLPLVAVDGRVLAMKGPKAEEELRVSGDALELLGAGDVAVFDAYPESFENDLVIISVIKMRTTPKRYPRASGLPKREPL